MKLVECTVVYFCQYEEIFKQYIFAKNMETYKFKCGIVPKDGVYVIMISAFQYW